MKSKLGKIKFFNLLSPLVQNGSSLKDEIVGNADFIITSDGDRVYQRSDNSLFSSNFEPIVGSSSVTGFFVGGASEFCVLRRDGGTLYIIRYITSVSTIARAQVGNISYPSTYEPNTGIIYDPSSERIYRVTSNGFVNIGSEITNFGTNNPGSSNAWIIPADGTTLSNFRYLSQNQAKGLYVNDDTFIDFGLNGEGGSLEVHCDEFDNNNLINVSGSTQGYQGQVKVRCNTLTQRGSISNLGIGLEFGQNVDIGVQV